MSKKHGHRLCRMALTLAILIAGLFLAGVNQAKAQARQGFDKADKTVYKAAADHAPSHSASARSATQADRETVLRACATAFGPSLDLQKGLFAVNRFYLLEAKFDDRGRVTQLGVLPKHWFSDDHPEWNETDDVGELTEREYQSLLARLEGIRSKGALVKRAKMPIVSNLMARRRDIYKRAVLETGDIVDANRSDDAPRAIKYFVVYFNRGKK